MMRLNSGLVYLQLTATKNFFKKMIRKPLRLLGGVFLVGNVIFAPFIFKSGVQEYGLDTVANFVIIVTLANIYITLPSVLVYLKRKGVTFRKRDVNLMFTTPISPKSILIYTLLKTNLLSISVSFFVGLSGLFVFHLSPLTTLLYIAADCLVYNSLLMMVGLLMYGKTNITENAKSIMRWGVKAILMLIVVVIAVSFYQSTHHSFEISVLGESFKHALLNPLIFLIPIVGQGIGMFQFIILGPTVWNSLAFVTVFCLIVIFAIQVYKMPDDGSYYEDALNFAEDIERRVDRIEQNGGNPFASKRNKNRALQLSQVFKYSGSKVIFERQRLEMKRTSRFILKTTDLVFLGVSVIAGIFVFFSPEPVMVEHYTLWVVGITAYVGAFYSRKPLWIQEFKNSMFFTIPDSMLNKIMNASIFDYEMCFVRSAVAIIPVSLALMIHPLEIGISVVVSGLIFIMISCTKMVFDNYLALKIGKVVASFASLILNMIILLPIAFLILSALALGNEGVFLALIGAYTVGVSYGFLRWSSHLFTNLDTFKS